MSREENMKKLIKFILAGLVSCSLTACSTPSQNTPSTSAPSTTATSTETDYDVIVIGAGGAGLTAAISAKEAGANVIVLEKMGVIGGNTAISGGEMAAPNNWLQQEQGIEDSVEQFKEDIMVGGDNEANEALVSVLAENALDAAMWLKDDINVPFEDYMLFFGGHSVMRSLVPENASGSTITSSLKAKADELGIQVLTQTEATQLLMEDGKVNGVVANTKDGEITYHANKAVIIATGGFGSNVEMRKQYNPDMDEKILSTCTVGSTGDGITMAQAIGADVTDMEYIQTYPTCDIDSGLLLYVGDVRLAGRAILVNKEGKRFVEELERRDVISLAVTEQTDQVSYLFFDENGLAAADIMDAHSHEYDKLIEEGKLVKADTIEEAAEHFEIDAAALKETVETFNQYAKDGKDLDFNLRGTLTPFADEGPYYIMVSKPAVHHTMGGLVINTDAQVIDTAGNVIPGLYAAGEVTGDIHGTNRLGSDAIADIIVFGRIAGQNAAK